MVIKKRAVALFAVFAAFVSSVTAAILLFGDGTANAETDAETGYYYRQLDGQAAKFYEAIDEMQAQGLLKTGNAELDLIGGGYITAEQCATVAVSGDITLAFGAARDAYTLDHPEIFYIDFTYLSISVGTKNGGYVATLGTGRTDSYYIEDGFNGVQEVDSAIAAFDGEVERICEKAAALSETDMIKYVNSAITQSVTYSFCATADDKGTTYEDGAAHIRTAYGALVNGKAVCEGYARAFKTVMDRLGIECVLVQGYAVSNGGGLEPHAWNYVKVGGFWYGVDVTWNDTAGLEEEYLLRGNVFMRTEHIPDGVISESGYSFVYPELYPYDYGVSTDPNGMTVEEEYKTTESGATTLLFTVSYNGKGALRLAEEDGLYMVCRYVTKENGSVSCGNWIYMGAVEDYDYGTYSQTLVNSYVQYVQFAMIDYAPDDSLNIQYINEVGDGHISNISETHLNEAYGTYYAPPYVKTLSPANMSTIDVMQKYEVEVVYTERLVKEDGEAPVGVVFSSQHADIADYAKVTNITWDPSEPDKLKFTFTPSRMFNHRYEMYSFYTVNLKGEDSGKEPVCFSFITEQNSVACSRVYGDGRLYIKSYGEPSLVSAGDLSLTGWKDENGDYVSQNQRSQLMLVVTNTDLAQSEEMLGSAADISGVPQSAALASRTYELELDLCGQIVSIPDGSYMQLAFGFPAGYGPDDAGVTFKVYHFKRGEDGAIDYSATEELECVITEYGLIVTVTDFSPFAVVVYEKSAVPSLNKGVYARTLGFGGSIEGNAIRTVGAGESITYTLLPEEGYRVDRVLLNGEEITTDGGKVTLAYDDVAENNMLVVSFVSERVAEREAQEGITHIYPFIGTNAQTDPVAKDNSWIKGVIAVVAVAAACAAIFGLFMVFCKKSR